MNHTSALVLSLLLLGAISYSVTASFLVPFVRRFAISRGWVDDPARSVRKVHKEPVPYFGGVAIYLGFLFSVIVNYVFFHRLNSSMEYPSWFLSFIVGAFFILSIGTLDDIYDISPVKKLFSQLFIASLVFLGGVQLDHINLPILGLVEFGQISYLITVFVIVIVMNAVNIIDGLDGLAAGIVLIASFANLAMALYLELYFVALLAFIFIFCLAAFLKFNWYPAGMFLGDGGSLLISFILSVIMIQNVQASGKFSQGAAPFLVLFYPLLDLAFAIVRRVIKGKPMMSADNAHLHHFLMRNGFGHDGCVKIIMFFTGIMLIAALLFIFHLFIPGLLLLLLILAGLTTFFIYTGYFKPVLLNRYLQNRSRFKALHAYKNFLLIKVRHAESKDDLWSMMSGMAVEFSLPAISWFGNGNSERKIGEFSVPSLQIKSEKLVNSGTRFEYYIRQDFDDYIKAEIESFVKMVITAVDKRYGYLKKMGGV